MDDAGSAQERCAYPRHCRVHTFHSATSRRRASLGKRSAPPRTPYSALSRVRAQRKSTKTSTTFLSEAFRTYTDRLSLRLVHFLWEAHLTQPLGHLPTPCRRASLLVTFSTAGQSTARTVTCGDWCASAIPHTPDPAPISNTLTGDVALFAAFDNRAPEFTFCGLAFVPRGFGTTAITTAEERFYGENRRIKIGSGVLFQCS